MSAADKINDGGPAFPVPGLLSDDFNGLSLRDYFAGKALPALVAGPAAQNICDHDSRYDETNFAQVVAINAYEFADAMLRVRSGS